MLIVSAFPGLGKTYLGDKFRKDYFDRDFHETRSLAGVNPVLKNELVELFAKTIITQYVADTYKAIFITDYWPILEKVLSYDVIRDFVYVAPDTNDNEFMEQYKDRIIKRSGYPFYSDIVEPRLNDMPMVTEYLSYRRADIRYADSDHPYLSDIIR